jgi:hypothetical protein
MPTFIPVYVSVRREPRPISIPIPIPIPFHLSWTHQARTSSVLTVLTSVPLPCRVG